MINKFKDYADVADASYAMLHYIDENEVFDPRDDEFRAKIPAFKPIARWIYADGIKLGYEIKTPKYNNLSKLELKLLNNTIQNLIYRNKKDSKTKRITL